MKHTKYKVWMGSLMLGGGFSINPCGNVYDIKKALQPD